MSAIAPDAPTKVAPSTHRVNGELRLTYPTRGYAVSRNPFGVWSILPLVTLAFAGLAITVMATSDQLVIYSALGAFLVITTGLMLISAVSLKGSLNFTHDGITFERGKHHLTAAWEEVTGLIYTTDAGLCLTTRGQQQTKQNWKLPGGFRAQGGFAKIPLRFFGDRQFSILYDLRERLNERSWRSALEQAESRTRSTLRCDLVYAGAVAIGGLAIFSSYLSVS